MADKQQLVVKAVLQYPEGLELGTSPDIRRFRLIKEKAADAKGDLYCRLVDRLSIVFPDITGVNYSLYWKDADGDLVQFSSLEELQTAMDAMCDHVLRIYIIVHFDEIEDTTETEAEGQSDAAAESGSKKRVRFARAGRKFRRKLRRKRRTALSDPRTISKEYRTGARVLIRRLHQNEKDGVEVDSPQNTNASLAEMAPEVRAFIQQVNEEWHTKLANLRPVVVARRMRMKPRTLPPGLERDHFLWLLRLMGRWHRRHAGLCRVMSGWSSGDTEADESGAEETMLSAVRRRRRQERLKKARLAKKGKAQQAPAPEAEKDEDEEEEKMSPEQHKVAREFRQAVRTLVKQLHKKDGGKPATNDQEKAALAALKPEVQAFVQKVANDWHTMLAKKAPKKVAKRMRKEKKEKKDLPADLQKEHYLWLCRYLRRWHARHAALCPFMSGWSSGEEGQESATDVDTGKEEEEEKKQAKGKKGKTSASSATSSSSESDSEGKKKKAVPKEFVKAVRILVNRYHDLKPKKEEKANEDETTLAALSPETRIFVQNFAKEWDHKLGNGKSPLVVARRMKRKKRALPAGVETGHVQFLCRFLSRWHCKHAAFCGPMGAWSSGETGGESETSGDERASFKRRAKLTAMLEASSGSEREDTDCVETACKPVSKEFRAGIRQWLNQQHKKPAAQAKAAKDDKAEKIALSPDVQQFLQRFAEEWHVKLAAAGGRPRATSREMKAQDRSVSLPSRMEREQYTWLCCFMARWHRKHAARCDVLSQGETLVQG